MWRKWWGIFLWANLPLPKPEPQCAYWEFTSADGSCILEEEVCDGYRNCRSAENERSFCPTAGAPPEAPRCGKNELTCDNQKCINCRFVCDGVWNYRKGEDEAEFCKPKKVPSAPDCDTNELMCTDGSCVKLYQLCDDRFDCADGADECKFLTGIDQCKGCMCLGDSRCLRWN